MSGSLGALATTARVSVLALVAVTPWVLPALVLVVLVRRRRLAARA